MLRVRVGLTGGIGAGKSTVARLLAERGAVVIDADSLAREVVQLGTPGYDAVVTEFGPAIHGESGLDRAALARVVFADPARLAALEAIVHPLVGVRMEELIAQAPADAVVVYDVPLLLEADLATVYDLVVVVDAPEDVRIQRLLARGMSESDARARIASQADAAALLALADIVIDNSGDESELAAQVDALWARLLGANLA